LHISNLAAPLGAASLGPIRGTTPRTTERLDAIRPFNAVAPFLSHEAADRDPDIDFNIIPSPETSIPRAYAAVIGYLNRVGRFARDPLTCPVVGRYRRT
jgi:hypothetical protein